MVDGTIRTVEQASEDLRELEDKISRLCQEFTRQYCTEMWITDIGMRPNVPYAPFPLVKVTVELSRACG